jgi:hypothetical protein
MCPYDGMSIPIPCSRGFVQPSEGNTVCDLCPSGSIDADRVSCSLCRAGKAFNGNTLYSQPSLLAHLFYTCQLMHPQ